jgi:hypothetical protein
MASFRIYRMRPHVKQNFRWAPHVAGLATVKQRDYRSDGEFEAPDEYALWAQLRNSEHALDVGDLVEEFVKAEVNEAIGEAGGETGVLKICKFVGFESAKWAETEALATSSVTESGIAQNT